MRMTYLVALAASAALFACGNVAGKTQCTKGQMDCVGDQVARVCGDDGQWASQTCPETQTCMAGSCAERTDLACVPEDSTCSDSTHALVCNTNGMGFTSMACPSGTMCSGAGLCTGACIVGESQCDGNGTLLTCTDGFHFTQSFCTPGTTSCVDTTTNFRFETAACKPIGCDQSLGTVCGNKANDPANTDPNFASQCVSSPTGLHWQSTQCAIPGSCADGSGCDTDCFPGETRCHSNGIQTCDASGKWSTTVTACTASPTGAAQVCMNTVAGGPVCGDPVCTQYAGACETDGFHACVAGKVSAAATPCAVGICQGGATVGGYEGGSCVPQCLPGDSRCDGNEAYQDCDAATYRWSGTASSCTADGVTRCLDYTDAQTDRPRTFCGECVPGTHRCTDAAGNPGAGAYVESCGTAGAALGKWQPTAACAVGQCQGLTGGDEGCVAQCAPGATLCLGNAPASPSNPQHPGTTGWGTCDATGHIPTTPTACSTGTSCRKGANGLPVGTGANACVVCVGTGISGGNELGLLDSNCTSASQIEQCTAANTWNTPTTCTSPSNGYCQGEAVGRPQCYSYSYCRESYIKSIYGSAYSCNLFWGDGAAQYWGGITDCCSDSYCSRTTGAYSPEPAVCD